MRRAVILASVGLLSAQTLFAQSSTRPKPDKGPRALALLELAPNGNGHLIPIAIMVDGDFYDASAYKANPVPMALDSGTVYEAERSGKSLGLFTVNNALQGPNNTWAGAGSWLPAGAKPASAGRRATNKPRDIEQEEGPPVLRRRQPKEKPAEPPPASAPAASSPAPPAQTSPAPASSASPAPAKTPADTASVAANTPPPSVEEDPDRPTLKRGAPPPSPQKPAGPSGAAAAKSSPGPANTKAAKGEKTEIQIVPAISDAGGPEPSSFIYPVKPDEEQQFRKKVLAMASDQIAAHARQMASQTIAPAEPPRASSAHKRAAKAPQPSFENVELRVIDPSSSNEPVLILTATARMPQSKKASQPEPPYTITLVARQDIYGDLHKVFSNITDAQHLDLTPRYDFIDVVDADGDGRGELLFRKVSDSAHAFTVFRIIGNQLWPLFDGSLGS